jgi:hypothetical protein
MKNVTVFFLVVAMFLFSCGDNSVKANGGSAIDGMWQRSNGELHFFLNFYEDNWMFSETTGEEMFFAVAAGLPEYFSGERSKGTWNSDSTISALSSGTVALTVTHTRSSRTGGDWENFPAEYNSVKTNTVTYDLNASGDVLTIRDAALTTAGVWGTLEGTYQKQ